MFQGFSKFRTSLTGLVFLRRISRALDAHNKLLEEQIALDRMKLQIEHPAAYKSHLVNRSRTGRVTDISVAKVEDWNTQWREGHPESDEEE